MEIIYFISGAILFGSLFYISLKFLSNFSEAVKNANRSIELDKLKILEATRTREDELLKQAKAESLQIGQKVRIYKVDSKMYESEIVNVIYREGYSWYAMYHVLDENGIIREYDREDLQLIN